MDVEGDDVAAMDVDDEEDMPAAVGRKDDAGDGIDSKLFMGQDRGWLDEKEKKARLGYIQMNVMSPPSGMKWGHFNDPEYRQEWIKKLVDQYPYQLWNCKDDMAMTGAV